MKNKITLLIVIFASLFFNSCEDVVDIPLDTDEPRLVIDASINWFKGTSGNDQVIKLSTTTDYYSNEIPPVLGATVFIANSAGTIFNFIETPNTGEYVCSDFVPVLNETYTLTVINNGQTYTATETLKPVASITSVEQEMQEHFGTEALEIKAFFEDPADAENFYLYKYKFTDSPTPDYSVAEDQFFQGNTFFSVVYQEDTNPGDQVEIMHYGISETYYNYMRILLSVAGSMSGGPFQSPPATVRGNITNLTDFDNYALGYFRLSEADVTNYTIE